MIRTMLVGADRALLNETADLLRHAGSQTLVVADVGRAEKELLRFRPEMIVVSLDDPEASGWKLMFRHGFNGGAQVIAITANGEASQELTVLRLGALDYVRLPVSPEVLFARITFRARPVDKKSEHIVERGLEVPSKRGTLVMDKSRFQSFWLESELFLTKTEFDLLHALARHDGVVKSREQLIEIVYDYGHQGGVNDRNIDSHIKRLRNKFRKFDPAFDGIETIYGIGYKLSLDRARRAKQNSLPFQDTKRVGYSARTGMSNVVPVSQSVMRAARQ
ncbi:response regulator transcription factor [Lutimaribacter sp. EGI FJ00015]|uniref:Response regulator transcription factor n=1 Tax=Lutimaribacter degradans TaxID=2945989 RepID=A0ACC5ZZZ1_9RHOB|nr:response regulator transcription factor [Lutimaribacter sp. EGI FJ00013]MCM2563670.1 response regulator transcription factor [Lutimaribacter sp. EGI FJ00013]MCO0614853.1 response regulator transcription factor [Lutimaribacter sp. EGI FJ00015]MCO0637522.1 response regulator transcription factor [Lutimaribacter sp. EGI FJ00014]